MLRFSHQTLFLSIFAESPINFASSLFQVGKANLSIAYLK